MAQQDLFKTYYRLTKPGIIYGNVFTATAGFLLASRWHIDWTLLVATLLGMSLVMASACVFNNYIDRDIDKNMSRTKQRAFVTGAVPVQTALIYATGLGLLGFLLLIISVNLLTALLGFLAFVDYVVLYGIAKRRSAHGTLVGSIAGALPPVAGYTAVTNHLDGGAILLFLILTFWQMPHFYSIALYRYKDYKNAHLPVLPVKKGTQLTKQQILVYIVGFTVAAGLLSIFGYTGMIYFIVAMSLGVLWFYRGISNFQQADSAKWGRSMFLFSLIVLTTLSVAIAVGAVLP